MSRTKPLSLLFMLTLFIFFVPSTGQSAEAEKSPQWNRTWSVDLFEQAKKEDKLILLDMEAVWCHWCHVMDRETYAKDSVLSIINNHYIPVKIDQDSNPALAQRYRDWGWPATIILDGDGQELKKMRGFFAEDRFAEILQRLAETRAPEIKPESNYAGAAKGILADDQIEYILSVYDTLYDEKNGGWGRIHRFIMGWPEEYALLQAEAGNNSEAQRARKTLAGALNLIDPVWGGAYQYSDEHDWLSPHFEKIGDVQYEFMRIYSLAYSIFKDPKYKKASEDIYRYLIDFMQSPDGAFYSSQNADLNEEIDGHAFYPLDDAGRRALGMPRIDEAIYTNNNGWYIQGMAAHYDATGDEDILQTAITAAEWILRHHRRRDNGFIHGKNSRSGQYLDDNAEISRAFLALYQSTGDRKWLNEAKKTARYIIRQFSDQENAGFFNSVLPEESIFERPYKNVRSNTSMTRHLTRLYHYSGETEFKDAAEFGMRFLASEELIYTEPFKPGIVLADQELREDPIHVVIVGRKDNAKAKSLFKAALAYPNSYKQVEWYDRSEGTLPGAAGQIEYPELATPAAFACANGFCSPPIENPDEIYTELKRFKDTSY